MADRDRLRPMPIKNTADTGLSKKTTCKDLDNNNIHKYKVSTIFLHYNQFNSSTSLKSLDAA